MATVGHGSGARLGDSQSADPELAVVVRVARVFAAVTAESIAQAGSLVTLPQLRVLVVVSETTGASNSAVAEALGIHFYNASRMCDRLIQAGLLERRDNPTNRRRVELTVTSTATALLASVTDYRRVAFRRMLASVPAEHRDSLIAAFTLFADVGERQHEVTTALMP